MPADVSFTADGQYAYLPCSFSNDVLKIEVGVNPPATLLEIPVGEFPNGIVLSPTADRAYGIYIMLAPSRSEAERAAAQDPFHIHGVRTMEILEWNPIHAFRLDGPTLADVERMATGK